MTTNEATEPGKVAVGPTEPSVEANGTAAGPQLSSVPLATASDKSEMAPPAASTAVLATWLLLGAVAASSLGVAAWAWRAQARAETVAKQAEEEHDKAKKESALAREERDQAEAARQAADKQRDETLAAVKASLRSELETKAVLAFVRSKLLSAGKASGWPAQRTKDVTLRKAIDACQSDLESEFGDSPLVEALIREILGSSYLDMGEAVLAVKQYERALALREALQGTDHADAASCRNELAVAYRLAGRIQHPHSANLADRLALHAAVLLAQKKLPAAEQKLRECLAIRQRVEPEHWATFHAAALLGDALLAQEKYAEAEKMLLLGYGGLKERQAKIPGLEKNCLTHALDRLIDLYDAWNRPPEAARWRKERMAAMAVNN